jgi:CRISPR type III-A-associated protein Csm2
MYNYAKNNNFNKNKGGGYPQKKEELTHFDFEKEGYFFNGNIRERLISEEANDIAKKLVDEHLSVTQLRAFFNEIKAIRNRLNEDGSNYLNIFPLILMIKSKAEYKAASKGAKIPEVFKSFLIANVNRLAQDKKDGKGKESFDAFVMFFEAIVGYFYGANGGR